MPISSYRVKGLVDQVRSRWRRRALMQGLALTALTLVFVGILFLLLYMQTSISLQVLLWGLGAGLVVVGYVAIRYMALPLMKKLDDRKVAMFIEERIPQLEDRLNSAIEVGDSLAPRSHPGSGAESRPSEGVLIDKLIDDATRQVRAIPVTTVVDHKRERFLAYAAAAMVFLFLVFGYNASDEIMNAFSGAQLTLAATPEEPYMRIEPGSVELEKGESQEVIVSLRDESEADVLLHYKIGSGEWQKEPMSKGLGRPVFLYEFINLQEPLKYFVLHDQVQSETYDITLYEFPGVEQIHLSYTYPEYTGAPEQTESNTGDIRGLKGSTVTITVTTTGRVETADMVLEDGRRLPLNDIDAGQFRIRYPLTEDTYYHIALEDQAGKANKFPEEYQVIALDDEKPIITITDPQQDVRVNAIDEVLVAAEVSDDYGVKEAHLHVSVNGEDEEVYPLTAAGDTRALEIEGDHVIFLEDYILEPGDVISYYVEADDYFPQHAPVASDMYFIEVVPFDTRYSQVNNMGGGGMPGGGMQSRTVISQQEIIAATWKLLRQKDERTESDFEEARKGLVQAQQNLKLDIEDRLNSTTFAVELRTDEDMQKIAAHLRDAVTEMDAAVDDLNDGDLEEALGPERRALNALLKADALNREREVTMNNANQAGGGGGGAMEDRMTELMDLELDISRDKYEIQQQRSSSAQQQQQQMDEALERIKELARRQQRIANQRQRNLEGENKKRFIERLKRDQDELREQTQQLAQNLQRQAQSGQQQQGGEQLQEGLERAMDHMREAERALRNEDEQRASASQQQALNELDRLQKELQIAGAETPREMIDDLAREFADLREQEAQLGKDIQESYEEAINNGGRIRRSELERLREKRNNMISRLEQFERQAEAVESGTRSEDPEIASEVRNMLQQMKREELDKKMNDSEQALENGWLDFAERLEGDIEETMERMASQVRELQNELPQTDEEQLRRALADLQNLRERLERLESQATREGAPSEGQNSASASSDSPDSRSGRARAARMRNELERAQEAMERLEGQLEGNEGMQRMLRRAANSLRNVTDASNTGILIDEESARDFFNEDVYDPFSELEIQLAQQLDSIEMEKKLFGARNAQVPDEYRDTVDRYYEALSKSTDN